ncbi:MAG: DUF1818 family protein [Chloroflexaceae bacterium]|nr:DUF1818 family protein [Chloroflexaceae bacterium]
MERFLKQGKGWRLGWNPQAEVYKGLVGAEDWAMELTEAELRDFCRLLIELAEIMTGMAGELVEQERLACEASSDLLWLEAEGFPHDYTLRLIVQQGRCGEGNWTSEAVPELVRAAQLPGVF